MKSLMVLVGMLGLTACGDGGGGNPGGGSCTLTLSGARSGSFPCVANAAFTAGNATSALSAVAQPAPDGYSAVSFSIEVAGDVQTKVYGDADVTMGGATVVTSSGSSWVGGSSGGSRQGTIRDLTITSKKLLASSSGTTLYEIHGSLHATLTDASAMGLAAVDMAATF